MYNRYIPRSDGTYQKNRMPESQRPPQRPPQHDPPPPVRPAEPEACQQELPPSHPPVQNSSALSFLKRLLPKGLDTGDLLIIVLLLLMAGDCEEDQNSAILTLALYLFL